MPFERGCCRHPPSSPLHRLEKSGLCASEGMCFECLYQSKGPLLWRCPICGCCRPERGSGLRRRDTAGKLTAPSSEYTDRDAAHSQSLCCFRWTSSLCFCVSCCTVSFIILFVVLISFYPINAPFYIAFSPALWGCHIVFSPCVPFIFCVCVFDSQTPPGSVLPVCDSGAVSFASFMLFYCLFCKLACWIWH